MILNNFFIGMVFLGSYFSYLNFRQPIIGYLIVLGFLFIFCYSSKKIVISNKTILLSITLLIITLLSAFNAEKISVVGFTQLLFYPLGLLLIFTMQSNLKYQNKDYLYRVGDFILVFLLLNISVAITNSIIGPISLPVLGTLELGRTMFFLPLRTSGGLLFGINYFAISSVVLPLIAVYFYQLSSHKISGLRKLSLLICFLSIILASSRSVTAIAFLIFVLYRMNKYFDARRIIFITFIMICTVSILGGSLYAYLLTDDDLSHSLRLYKGLNNRDDIWLAAETIIMNNPILGAGSISTFESKLIQYGSPTTAVQNMYILAFLKNGLFGLIFLVLLLTYTLYKAYKNNTQYLSLYFIVILSIIDGFFRSYSIGGFGVVSLSLTFAISALLHERKD